MIREKRKKKRKLKLFLKIFLILVTVVGLSALIVLTVFRTKTVEIEGNEIYSAQAIEDTIFKDEYCQNSLYLYFKYNFLEKQPIPFIDTLEVSFINPQHVKITVYEKASIGCLFDEETQQYYYFDKDGIVIEQSKTKLSDVTLVTGLTYESLELYEVMQLEDSNILNYLLLMSQNLQKYQLSATEIQVSGKGKINLNFGNIVVKLGKNVRTEEKIMRLQKILPQLDGQTGVLDLQDWSGSGADIIFQQTTDASGDA